ncbi:MAG: hypothetical protein WCS60_10170, partial [Hydrogenophaga sp.]
LRLRQPERLQGHVPAPLRHAPFSSIELQGAQLSAGEIGPLKTHEERWVDLTPPAMMAFKAVRGAFSDDDGHIFWNPITSRA